MANSPQARKRARQNEVRRVRNKANMSSLRTSMKKLRQLIEAGEKDNAATQYRVVTKELDQAASKNLIHKKNADRSKSRFAVSVNKLG